jgi:hypothetical protein
MRPIEDGPIAVWPPTGWTTEVAERKCTERVRSSEALGSGAVGSMKPAGSAPYSEAAVLHLSTIATGLGRQFEVGRDQRANRWAWWCCVSACAGIRARVPRCVGQMLVAAGR